ncbi:MAG TPA: NADH-quinone oxidoreductase subunit C [Microthrixaceae bacterium]|nr:NADH-quinone oxidoreductase subunit C [Microthrixaceae bacterium]HMT24663.1 NADH-quinone oxidoreductase subunit C [Microthrixaceae bacterium]HMT60125.1 NADH-quinone oxidoreductase subunit C [Microthrixaceae bacterium]
MSSNDTDTTADVEPVARDEAREQLLGTIRGYLGDAVVGSHILPGRDLWVRVTNEAWAEAAETVRFAMGARYFGFLSAIDWMPSPFGRSMDSEVDRLVKGESEKAPTAQTTGYAGGDTRFQAIARVANLRDGWGVTFKADLADDAPSIATWTTVYAGADWHEREVYEMFGVEFVGHPALRKIYLPADFEGHPLRKDFPLLARMVKPWPGIVDTEPMPGGDGADDADTKEAS